MSKGEVLLMSLKTSGKVDKFIVSLNLPTDTASVLLESEKDCQEFFEVFYKRNKYAIDDLLDYRENKIEKSKKTVDLFIEECYNGNVRQAFQTTFYQLFTQDDMNVVENAIRNGVTSLEKLFIGFQKNPNENILKNIL